MPFGACESQTHPSSSLPVREPTVKLKRVRVRAWRAAYTAIR